MSRRCLNKIIETCAVRTDASEEKLRHYPPCCNARLIPPITATTDLPRGSTKSWHTSKISESSRNREYADLDQLLPGMLSTRGSRFLLFDERGFSSVNKLDI